MRQEVKTREFQEAQGPVSLVCGGKEETLSQTGEGKDLHPRLFSDICTYSVACTHLYSYTQMRMHTQTYTHTKIVRQDAWVDG